MASMIRRGKDEVYRVDGEANRSGEKYIIAMSGDRLRGIPILPAWMPIVEIRTPMVLHGFVRFGITYWEDVTLLTNYRQARAFIDARAEEWGKEELAEFDAEGLVDKTVQAASNAGRDFYSPTLYDKYDTGPRKRTSD